MTAYSLTPVGAEGATAACVKCGHADEHPQFFMPAIYPSWMTGVECADDVACIARRVVAGHRLPLSGLEPWVGLS